MDFQHQPLRPTYGHCNSFFTEPADDDSFYAKREEQRKQARAAARQIQIALAEELSTVTAEEYQDDILDDMEESEVRYIHQTIR